MTGGYAIQQASIADGVLSSQLRQVAEEEFSTTARKINRQAKQIGTEADYDETWGE